MPDLATSVSNLLTNSLQDPLGIGGDAPRLSWQLEADRRGVTQTAYEVHVATTEAGLASPDVWDSGTVESGQSVGVAYGGPALTSHTRYLWAVRVWDDAGSASEWSAPGSFEAGLLDTDEWEADWVADARTALLPTTSTQQDHPAALEPGSTLGQTFQADRPFDEAGGQMPTWATTDSDMTVSLRHDGPDGELIAERRVVDHPDNDWGSVSVDEPLPAGTYYLEISAVEGQVGWWSHNGDVYPYGTAFADGAPVAGDRVIWWIPVGGVDDEGLPVLRKDFTVHEEPVVSARVYAAAQGVYELRLNGERVGDHELAPGWTDYNKRIQYQTYDVTDLVKAGDNAVGAELSDGWFAGRLAIFGDEKYGSTTALIAQLRIEYADGTVDVVGTDDSWRSTPGAIVSADLLDGETYDARRAAELGAWDESPYDDSGWDTAAVHPSATDLLEPQDDQPVRVTERRPAEAIDSPTEGTYLYDLGQNMVGKASVTLTGTPGQTVKLRHAEVLNPDGTMYVANLRSAQATDYYTFATSEPETYTPTFTFHGFRYVEISGVDSPPPTDAVTGLVMGMDGDLVSEFETSSPMVNQLHINIVWGQRGNFLSIPTDTPARDERMGWTGDINVFARTAVYNMDSQAFLDKWLQDLRDTQRSDGAFPGVAPVIPDSFDGGYGRAGWADAGVNVPWTLWQAYGDTYVIDENYVAMKRYVDYLAADSNGYIRSTPGYLDWLNLDDPTPADVLDTAFVAKSTRQFAQMAAAVGNDADADDYGVRYENIKEAFQDNFIAADGTVKGDSQTAYILAITNDLVPDDKRDAVTEQFVETIERRDWHLSTGFLGVDGLLPALTKIGRSDVAYRLLQNEDYPSWGYEIGKCATTIWERWNSIMPDGSFGPVDMNSFNHYAYGASGEWMYRTLAGVSALEPGYRSTLIAPEPGGGITSSDFSYDTRYGTIESAWEQTDAGLTLDVTVPTGTTATLRIPAESRWAVTEGGGVPAEQAEAVRFVEMDGGVAVLEIGSGSYAFASDAVLGDIGDAAAEVGAHVALVDDLADSGALAGPPSKHLQAQLRKLAREVADAQQAHLESEGAASTADKLHRALATAASLDRWVRKQADAGRVDPAVAGQLTERLRVVEKRLSAASAALVGAGGVARR